MDVRGAIPQWLLGWLRGVYRDRGILYFAYRSSWDRAYPLLCLHSFYWMARAIFTGEPLVHFIGDSHTAAYNLQKRFVTHHIGQATAHNLAKENSSSGSRYIFSKVLSRINPRRDILVLVFGEIDCRVHFYYQFKKHRGKISMESLMDTTIENYGQVLSSLGAKGFRFAVQGVPPAARQKNIYGYPFFGSPGARSKISRRFNQKLLLYCKKKGYVFIDVYSSSADKQGFITKKFARDEVHFNARIVPFVVRQLNRHFLLNI